MSHSASSTPSHPSTGLAQAALGLPVRLLRAWRRESEMQAAVRSLEQLGDHTLRDIGLARGDIAAGVRRRLSDR